MFHSFIHSFIHSFMYYSRHPSITYIQSWDVMWWSIVVIYNFSEPEIKVFGTTAFVRPSFVQPSIVRISLFWSVQRDIGLVHSKNQQVSVHHSSAKAWSEEYAGTMLPDWNMEMEHFPLVPTSHKGCRYKMACLWKLQKNFKWRTDIASKWYPLKLRMFIDEYWFIFTFY